MKRILCFGDSNTWGHDPIDGSRLKRPWPKVLREQLLDCEIIEDGTCGRATVFGEIDEAGHNGIVSFCEKYIKNENKFDLVIIMLGTNDYLNENSSTPDKVAEDLRLYVRETRKKYGDEQKMLIVSPIYIRDEVMKHPVFSQLYSNQSVISSHETAQNIRRMTDEENVDFMDAALYAEASEMDGVHMDEKEHAKLAEGMAEKIKSILML